MISFVAVDAYFFFRPGQALAQLAAGVVMVTVALLARGGVPLPTAMALDTVVVALGVVTRGLAQRASSASKDALTGLANRRGFDAALQRLLAAAARTRKPVTVALLDLDHFKASLTPAATRPGTLS